MKTQSISISGFRYFHIYSMLPYTIIMNVLSGNNDCVYNKWEGENERIYIYLIN